MYLWWIKKTIVREIKARISRQLLNWGDQERIQILHANLRISLYSLQELQEVGIIFPVVINRGDSGVKIVDIRTVAAEIVGLHSC